MSLSDLKSCYSRDFCIFIRKSKTSVERYVVTRPPLSRRLVHTSTHKSSLKQRRNENHIDPITTLAERLTARIVSITLLLRVQVAKSVNERNVLIGVVSICS